VSFEAIRDCSLLAIVFMVILPHGTGNRRRATGFVMIDEVSQPQTDQNDIKITPRGSVKKCPG